MSLEKSPKVGRLYVVVRASVMSCFGCKGLRGLGECKLFSADDIPLLEPAVCVQQVLVFLGDKGFCIANLPSAYLSVSKAYITWCHRLSSFHLVNTSGRLGSFPTLVAPTRWIVRTWCAPIIFREDLVALRHSTFNRISLHIPATLITILSLLKKLGSQLRWLPWSMMYSL